MYVVFQVCVSFVNDSWLYVDGEESCYKLALSY